MNYTDKLNTLNPSDMPMEDTHYYRYMTDGGYRDNIIECMRSYLESLGYIVGSDKVSTDVSRKLGYIHAQYFRNIIRPTIKPLPDNWLDSPEL